MHEAVSLIFVRPKHAPRLALISVIDVTTATTGTITAEIQLLLGMIGVDGFLPGL